FEALLFSSRFDTRGAAPLIFSDQFLQLSTLLPSSFVYGLGQHLEGLLLDTYWKRRVLWNADAIPQPESNLYGSHPFYMVLEPAGAAHGVFLLNSNAIEVILQPTPALTFRATGGILDLYVFLGPSPDQVISQYTEVIGRPFLPPYWSLGYHQCRFGYKSVEETKKVWKRTRDAGIPFDVQWNDIDYMERQNDFTIDPLAFADLPEFVDELHQVGMRYVIITDPGISAGEDPGTYAPFDLGIKDDVFVKNSSGLPFVGKVWNPTATVFPDFTRPNAVLYWTSLIAAFRDRLPFDGLWIDMNEPSNFWDGQKHGCPKNSSLEHPPFLPHVNGRLLSHKTLCMTARHYIGPHYDVHNLYGISEAIATNAALKMTKGTEAPFIISRSSFPGLGKFAGHWSGDVYSDWFNLWKSIGSVLTANLLGIPMAGADICGFNGNTTAALCNRWMQLGAFYPFSRNHNTDDGIDQDPVALGELVVRSSVKALTQRYTLLPFLYTLFAKAHSSGIPVARPLFFKYPQDSETYAMDTQFLWGNELMIIPVLEENATSVEAYFPEGKWYDWYSGHVVSSSGQEYLSLPAALDTIPLVVAGGSVLPCQNPANTTTQSRLNPFGLVIALNEDGQASGELVWNKPQDPGFTEWTFRAISNHFTAVPVLHKPDEEVLTLEWITFYGVTSKVFLVKVNGAEVNYTYSAVSQTIRISNMAVNFKEPISVLYF
ncbi:UNVERIFIED_CONTAM: hypothetical protein GTU68_019351, partial [Idotea baltica]|nr:hypothetical protein [Idotea baltica]